MPSFPRRRAARPATACPSFRCATSSCFPYVVMPLLVGRAGVARRRSRRRAARTDCCSSSRSATRRREEPAAARPATASASSRGSSRRTRLGERARRACSSKASPRARVTRYVPGAGLPARASSSRCRALADGSGDDEVRLRRALVAVRGVRRAASAAPERGRRRSSRAPTRRRGRRSASRRTSAVDSSVRQALLEIADAPRPARRARPTCSRARSSCCELERKIDDDVRGSLFQNQREFYLQEQLKAIHRELGGEDGDDVDELERRSRRRDCPSRCSTRARRELRRLRRLSPMSPESGVARTFLDWIVALPWTERTDDVLDVAHARRVLDEDHYGLEDVKDRILDYIGVLSLVERLDGPILCLVGPPGVGKTSLGRSIARALGRKFVRMSLGGVRDEAEIRGHRRTYIGAMPGRVDPGDAPRRSGEPGDPARRDRQARAATTAAIRRRRCSRCSTRSRTRRSTITTSRSTTISRRCCSSRRRTRSPQIPEPLRDRMEIIRLAGYLDQEKYAIARQFLAAAAAASARPRSGDGDVGRGRASRRSCTATRARRACASSSGGSGGWRASSRARARNGARRYAQRRDDAGRTITCTPTMLQRLLGVAPFDPAANTLEDKVGVATGLAYTSVGGDVLEIEVSVVPRPRASCSSPARSAT